MSVSRGSRGRWNLGAAAPASRSMPARRRARSPGRPPRSPRGWPDPCARSSPSGTTRRARCGGRGSSRPPVAGAATSRRPCARGASGRSRRTAPPSRGGSRLPVRRWSLRRRLRAHPVDAGRPGGGSQQSLSGCTCRRPARSPSSSTRRRGSRRRPHRRSTRRSTRCPTATLPVALARVERPVAAHVERRGVLPGEVEGRVARVLPGGRRLVDTRRPRVASRRCFGQYAGPVMALPYVRREWKTTQSSRPPRPERTSARSRGPCRGSRRRRGSWLHRGRSVPSSGPRCHDARDVQVPRDAERSRARCCARRGSTGGRASAVAGTGSAAAPSVDRRRHGLSLIERRLPRRPGPSRRPANRGWSGPRRQELAVRGEGRHPERHAFGAPVLGIAAAVTASKAPVCWPMLPRSEPWRQFSTTTAPSGDSAGERQRLRRARRHREPGAHALPEDCRSWLNDVSDGQVPSISSTACWPLAETVWHDGHVTLEPRKSSGAVAPAWMRITRPVLIAQ